MKGVLIMCNNKHLTLDDRLMIERELFFNLSFKQIAKLINIEIILCIEILAL